MKHCLKENPFHHRGTFVIKEETFENNYPLVERIMSSGIVILRAENCFATRSTRYFACGKCFEFVEPYSSIPEYDIIHIEHKGVTCFTFVKKE